MAAVVPPVRLVGRRASRSAGMFHVKHPYALEGGAGWDPCRRAPCDGSFPCAWKRMLAMHDSSPSPFLPTWCFPPRLRRQAPIIVHSAHSLPPRFPAFCGRCRREPVQVERGGRPPRLAPPPDWRGLPDPPRTGARPLPADLRLNLILTPAPSIFTPRSCGSSYAGFVAVLSYAPPRKRTDRKGSRWNS